MTTGVASNVVALAAATTATAVISVKSLLPFRLQHVFSRSVLDTLTTIARHSAIAGPYDFAGKTVSDIRSAAHQGLVSFQQAYQELTKRLQDMPEDTSELSLQKMLAAVKEMNENLKDGAKSAVVAFSGLDHGAFLFVLGKVSKVARSTKEAVICALCEDDSKMASGSGTDASTSIARPRNVEEFMCCINLWTMVLHATGLANFLVIATFLDKVIYEPMRLGNITDHALAFEFLVVYLHRIQQSQGRFTLADVYELSGGMDEARLVAKNAVNSFRTHGGNPASTPDEVKVTGFTATARGYCVAFNLGKKHQARSLHPDGKCKFNHACDQFVTDKGPDGRCGGSMRWFHFSLV